MCHHDISIHTNFHQNRSINESVRIIWALHDFVDPLMLYLIKNLKIHPF